MAIIVAFLIEKVVRRVALSEPIRREWTAILVMALAMSLAALGLLTAASGFGLPLLLIGPLLMVGSIAMAPSRKRMAAVGIILAYGVFVALAVIIVSG